VFSSTRAGTRVRSVAALVAGVALVLPMLGGVAAAADSHGSRGISKATAFTAVAGSIPTPPQAVKGSDGKYWLAYELVITSVVPFTLDVTSIEVRNAHTERVIATFSGPDLTAAMRPIAAASAESVPDPTSLPASATAVVWLDVAVAKRTDIPRALDHRVDLRPVNAPAGAPASLDATLGRVRVDRTPPILLASPLAPGTWLANDGCCLDYTHHRRGFVALNGDAAVPQRYAIDFYKVDDQHRTWVGDPTDVTSYLAYGQPVIAAAAGRVVASFDGLPDQEPPGPPPIPPIGDTVGNHVILKVRPGIFLLYAHLKPGSVLVKQGQRLKLGQRIGRIGTSGNSSTPHLHFQVLTSKTFFPADSAPFRFRRFGLVGRLVVTEGTERIWDDNLGLQPTGELPYAAARDPGPRRREMPLDRDIITFAR
jgi:Peptidase family M23